MRCDPDTVIFSFCQINNHVYKKLNSEKLKQNNLPMTKVERNMLIQILAIATSIIALVIVGFYVLA